MGALVKTVACQPKDCGVDSGRHNYNQHIASYIVCYIGMLSSIVSQDNRPLQPLQIGCGFDLSTQQNFQPLELIGQSRVAMW